MFSGKTGTLVNWLDGEDDDELQHALEFCDINDDGFVDFWAGRPGAASVDGGCSEGRVDLVSGKDFTVLQSIWGEFCDISFRLQSVIEDINSDGIEDVLIGAPNYNGLGFDWGRVYAYSGANGSLIYDITGDTNFGRLGAEIARVGDVDGDLRPDYAVHGINLFVYSGDSGERLFEIPIAGTHLDAAGDVNKDGFDDVLVGSINYESSGRAFVFSGADQSIIYEFSSPGSENFGTAINAGDVNADGWDDFVISDGPNDTAAHDAGLAILYSGRTGQLLYRHQEPINNLILGADIGAAGDVNQDGFHDYLIRASGFKVGNDAVGRVGLYAGNDLYLQASPKPIHVGELLTLEGREGEPGARILLALTAIDEVPLFIPLRLSTFDGSGLCSWTVAVPAGLEGVVLEFTAFAERTVFGDGVMDSSPETVHIIDPCGVGEGDADCNLNGVLDSCDIDSGSSLDIDLNGIPDECQGVLLVPDVYPTIQFAVDQAGPGATIVVSDGLYSGVDNTMINVLGKAITIQSANGPENCIIDCENQSQAFLFENGEQADTILEGFTIRAGTAGKGGAIFVMAANPTIRQCIFENHSASTEGGALYAIESDLVLEDCEFRASDANQEGGALYVEIGNPVLRRCVFDVNLSGSHGGAASFRSVNATLENCVAIQNTSDNQGGGFSFLNSTLTMVNTLLADNTGFVNGGGIHIDGGSAELRHCTVANNLSNPLIGVGGGSIRMSFRSVLVGPLQY